MNGFPLLSPASSDNSDIMDGDMTDFLVTWKYAAMTKGITCSPVREHVLICMDRQCKRHESGTGKGLEGHAGMWMASTLEWSVVNSFTSLEPSRAVHSGQFEGWTHTDMDVACFGTDNEGTVSRHFFSRPDGRVRLRRYVALYDAYGGSLIEIGGNTDNTSDQERGEKIEAIVRGWCGGSDPINYVVMMDKRIADLSAKNVRLHNTVDVWKQTVKDHQLKIDELTRKLRFHLKRK
jgi:hypothetical protein